MNMIARFMKLSGLAVALLLNPIATVQAQFIHMTNLNTIMITGYIGTGGAVTIPGTINGLPVTYISPNAFSYTTNVTSITIGHNVTIGAGAFANNSSLTSVTIGNSVTRIDGSAFSHCTQLASVVIGNGVGRIPSFAFHGCTSLTSISIGSSVTDIGSRAFEGCTSLNSINIPVGVVGISAGAFQDCTSLSSVTIPNSVTMIGPWAFQGCTSLASVMIPESVISIEERSFYGCTSLTGIEIHSSNPSFSSVGGVVFDKNVTSLVHYPAGKAGHYTIPLGVVSFYRSAFAGCTELTGITIPDSVRFLGTFEGCTSLTSVTIPDRVTSIPDMAFKNCSRLTTATIGKNVTGIGREAFRDCSSLTSVYFHGRPPGVDQSAFAGADNVTFYYLSADSGAGPAPGWGSEFGGKPAVLWNPVFGAYGIQGNGFGFEITGTPEIPIVVEAGTDLSGSTWIPLYSGTLTDGLLQVNDHDWADRPIRFFRVRSP